MLKFSRVFFEVKHTDGHSESTFPWKTLEIKVLYRKVKRFKTRIKCHYIHPLDNIITPNHSTQFFRSSRLMEKLRNTSIEAVGQRSASAIRSQCKSYHYCETSLKFCGFSQPFQETDVQNMYYKTIKISLISKKNITVLSVWYSTLISLVDITFLYKRPHKANILGSRE